MPAINSMTSSLVIFEVLAFAAFGFSLAAFFSVSFSSALSFLLFSWIQ